MAKADYSAIYQQAYQLMNQAVMDFDCGTLCNYHCCRERDEYGEKMGIYLLPLEYEYMIKGQTIEKALEIVRHTNKVFELPPKIKSLYFADCGGTEHCLRAQRPIQCRTYPFEAHIEKEQLSLVVLKDQIHKCPLLERRAQWRPEFTKGIYKGWELLVTIPLVKYLVASDSERRRGEDIAWRYDGSGFEGV